MKRQDTQNAFAIICSAAFIVILILKPELCTKGAAEGLLLAGRVIIPSLFPFTACVLFIMKSGGTELFGFAAVHAQEVAIELAVLLLGTLLVLMVSEKLGCGEFCGFAAVVFIILLVSDSNRYVDATLRALQTILGVFIAWVINVRLFPYPGKPAVPPDPKQN